MKIYLAHPFLMRKEIRKWELEVEKNTEIELINPFYDIKRLDVSDVDAGKRKMNDVDPEEIVTNDLRLIESADMVIAILDDVPTYGTIMEMVYAHQMNKPIFCVVLNGHETNPWLRYHATKIFKQLEDMELILSLMELGKTLLEATNENI